MSKQVEILTSCGKHVHPAVPELGLPHCFCIDDGIRPAKDERSLRCCWCSDWVIFREVLSQKPGHGPYALVMTLEMK